MKKQKILVTGGLGFVGSNLVDYLKRDNARLRNDVTVIDNLSSPSSSRNYKRDDVKYIECDINDINKIGLSNDFDVIFHIAGKARVGESFVFPDQYIKANINGTQQVLEFARFCPNVKLVYAGSSSSESGAFLNPYSYSKFAGEQLCKLYNKAFDVETCVSRFYNVYGPRQATADSGYACVIAIFEDAFKKNKPFIITGDGNQRRDFTHVFDIVSGLVTLGLTNKTHSGCPVYCLGRGMNYSINELANMFGNDYKREYVKKRPGEVDSTLAPITGDLYNVFGWAPIYDLPQYINTIKQ